ncbi:MAG: aquaporin [Dehalococcoidia bacterium]
MEPSSDPERLRRCAVCWRHTGGPGATLPAGDEWQSFGLEIVLTFLLVYVILAVAHQARAPLPLAAAAAAGLEATFAGGGSGASTNPARSVGPAASAWEWRDQRCRPKRDGAERTGTAARRRTPKRLNISLRVQRAERFVRGESGGAGARRQRSGRPGRVELRVLSLHRAGCAEAVEGALDGLEGLLEVAVDPAAGSSRSSGPMGRIGRARPCLASSRRAAASSCDATTPLHEDCPTINSPALA